MKAWHVFDKGEAMTDREAFEEWHSRNYDTLPGTELHRVERQGMQKAWIAALASERAKQNAATNVGIDWANPATLNGSAPPAVQAEPVACSYCGMRSWHLAACQRPPADDEAVRLLTEVAETVPNMSIELEQAINAYLAKAKK